MDCNVFNSYPIPSVAWFGPQGGDPLIRERQLIIPNITRFKAGQYRCTVFDQRNKKSSYVTVTVQCKCRGQERRREGGGGEKGGEMGWRRGGILKKREGSGMKEKKRREMGRREGLKEIVTYSSGLPYFPTYIYIYIYYYVYMPEHFFSEKKVGQVSCVALH